MFNEYPYNNVSDLNLDYLLKSMKNLIYEMDNFVNLNTIKYADPIAWAIDRQYEENTIVLDSNGTAFLSKQPVPAGVSLANTDYWLKIADFNVMLETIKLSITAADEGIGTTATAPRNAGDFVWLDNDLYKVIANMIAGDSYVAGSNCEKTTVGNELRKLGIKVISVEGRADDLESDMEDVKEKIKPLEYGFKPVSVIAYGARGDGVSDDTAAFIAALTNESYLWIPNGTYLISVLDVPADRYLLGESRDAVLKQISSLKDNFIRAGSNDVFENLTIDANNASYAGSATGEYSALYIDGKTNVVVRNCHVTRGYQRTIHAKDSTYCLFDNCEVTESRDGGGISFTGSNAGHNVVRSCYSHNNGKDGIVFGQPHNTVVNSTLSGNGTKAGSCGVYMNVNAKYSIIEGCHIEYNTGSGIEFDNAANFTKVVNNYIIGNALWGIDIRQVNFLIITGNYIYRNETRHELAVSNDPNSSAQVVFRITHDVESRTILNDNYIDAGNETGYCIYVYGKDSSRNLGNNFCTGFTYAAIYDGSDITNLSGSVLGNAPLNVFMERIRARFLGDRFINIISGTAAVPDIKIIGNKPFKFQDSATGTPATITANLTGDVTGDVTGNLTGNVNGEVVGTLIGRLETKGNVEQRHGLYNGCIAYTGTGISVYYNSAWHDIRWS